MCIGKPAPIFGELIESGRLHEPGSVAAEIAVTDVIGENENDIGLISGGERRRDCTQRDSEGEEGANSHWRWEGYMGLGGDYANYPPD